MDLDLNWVKNNVKLGLKKIKINKDCIIDVKCVQMEELGRVRV